MRGLDRCWRRSRLQGPGSRAPLPLLLLRCLLVLVLRLLVLLVLRLLVLGLMERLMRLELQLLLLLLQLLLLVLELLELSVRDATGQRPHLQLRVLLLRACRQGQQSSTKRWGSRAGCHRCCSCGCMWACCCGCCSMRPCPT